MNWRPEPPFGGDAPLRQGAHPISQVPVQPLVPRGHDGVVGRSIAPLGNLLARGSGLSAHWGTHSHALAMSAISLDVKVAIYAIFNAYWAPLTFNLPLPPQDIDGNWRRILDTALPSPHDIIPLGEPLPEIKGSYEVAPAPPVYSSAGGFHQRAK